VSDFFIFLGKEDVEEKGEKPHLAIRLKPVNIIEPDIMTVQPPRTAWGMLVRTTPMTGKRPNGTAFPQDSILEDLFFEKTHMIN